MSQDPNYLFKQRNLNTRLLEAVRDNNLDSVKRLLANGAKADTQCRESKLSACHFAAFYGFEDILEELVNSNADVTVRDLSGVQPHHLAAISTNNGSVRCLRLLLQEQDSLADSRVHQYQPDIVPKEEGLDSYRHNHKELVKEVEKIKDGSTALYIAIKNANALNAETVKELLARKATVNDEIMSLALHSNTDIFIMLANAFIPTTGPLQVAIMQGNVLEVEKLLETEEDFPPTTLHLAIHHCLKHTNKSKIDDYNKIIQILLARNPSSINVKDENGKTALYLAIEGKLDVVDILLEEADLSIKCKDEETVIHLVSRNGDSVLLKYLLDSLPSKDILLTRDKNELTPLRSAIAAGSFGCVKVLLETGVVESTTEVGVWCDGGTLLHAAIESKKNNDQTLQIVMGYIRKNNVSDINKRNNEGLAAVDLATKKGEARCLEELLKCDEIKLKPDIGEKRSTALHHAARNGFFLCMVKLLDRCEELVDIPDEKGITPLIYAAQGRYSKCVELLLKKGANLAVKDSENRTAIDIIMYNIPNAVRMIDDMLDAYIVPWKDDSLLTAVTVVTAHPVNNTQVKKNTNNNPIKEKKPLLPNGNNNLGPSKEVCAIKLDYKCLVGGSRQLEVIEAVNDCRIGQVREQFFFHPLVKTFLSYKWDKVRVFFWTLLAVYLFHSASVTALAVHLYVDCVALHSCSPPFIVLLYLWLWRLATLVTFLPVILMEIISWLLIGKLHFGIKTCLKWMAISLTGIFICVPKFSWGLYLASLTVLLSWINLLLFYSLSPTGGSYIQLFFEIAIKVFRVFSSFLFLLVGFGMSFFILFNGREPFSYVDRSLFKVVAMISDLNYDDTMKDYKDESWAFDILARVMYLTFYVLAAVVMMNLIVGLSVNVVTEHRGESKQLAKQGSFLSLVDKFYHYDGNNKFLSFLKQNVGKPKDLDTSHLLVYPLNQTVTQKLHKQLVFEVLNMKKQFSLENEVRKIYRTSQEILDKLDSLDSFLKKS